MHTEPTVTARRCGFAWPGTYGHECGKPAVFAGIRASEHTATGIFFAARCAACREHKGGDNAGITAWEVFDATKHVNRWR